MPSNQTPPHSTGQSATPSDPLPPPGALLEQTPFAWRQVPAGLDLDRLTDIQWRADACGPGSILCFQRFDDGHSDAALFERYLAGSPFAVLVTNRPMDSFDALRDSGKAVFVTEPEAYGDTVARLCDAFYPMPRNHWRIAAVTGTNGKTTTVKYL